MSGSRPGSAVRHSSSWRGEDRPDALPEDAEEEQLGASAAQPQDADQQRDQAETGGAAEHSTNGTAESVGASAGGHKNSQQVVEAAADLQGKVDAAADPGSSEEVPAGPGASLPAEAGDATVGHAAAEMSDSSERHSGAAAPDQVKDGEDASEPHSPARRDPYSFVRRVPTAADSPQSSPRTGGYGWARQQSRQGSPPQGMSDSRGQLSPRMAAARQAAEQADHIVADAAAADAASGIAAEAAAAVAAAASAGVVVLDSRRQSSSSGGAPAGEDSGSDRQSPAQRAVQRLHESTARRAAALDQQRSSDNGTRSAPSDALQPDDRNGHFTSSAASTHGIEVRHEPASASCTPAALVEMLDYLSHCQIHRSVVVWSPHPEAAVALWCNRPLSLLACRACHSRPLTAIAGSAGCRRLRPATCQRPAIQALVCRAALSCCARPL